MQPPSPIAVKGPPTGARPEYCLVDSHGRIVAAEAQLWTLLGVPSEFTAARLDELIYLDGPDDGMAQDLLRRIGPVFANGTEISLAVVWAAGDRRGEPAQIDVRPLLGATPALALVALGSGETRSQPFIDPLTGVADRREIAARAAHWRRCDPQTPFAVLFVDLDGFKAINDRHGHALGDRLLETVAARWLKCVRDGDLVARYGGDEFVILLKDIAAQADAQPVIERLRAAAAEPVDVGRERLTVSATVGLAIATDQRQSIDELIDDADRAMYAGKRRRPR